MFLYFPASPCLFLLFPLVTCLCVQEHIHIFTRYHQFLQLRVSGIMTNSPYILVLDCDMYCNDPTSARQAMCFHLDPKISPSLAFIQFPQKFRNINKNDIYDGQLRKIFVVNKLISSRFSWILQCLEEIGSCPRMNPIKFLALLGILMRVLQ